MRGTLEEALQAGLIKLLEIMGNLDDFDDLKALRCPLLRDEPERAERSKGLIILIQPAQRC
jgi:hypothetical protein